MDVRNLKSMNAWIKNISYGEFDPGSERTLAAWIRHASRTEFLAFSRT